MSAKHGREERVEAYTRALLEAARAEQRTNPDLTQLQHARKFSPEVLETLAIMQQQGDLDLLDSIATQFKEILDSQDTTVSVTVITAVEMDDRLRKKVSEVCQRNFNAPIYLVERVDRSILGGIILEARGQRFDASAAAQLAQIRKTLAQTFVGGDSQ